METYLYLREPLPVWKNSLDFSEAGPEEGSSDWWTNNREQESDRSCKGRALGRCHNQRYAGTYV